MITSWHNGTCSTAGTPGSGHVLQVWLRSAALVALGYLALAIQTWIITSMSLGTTLPL